MEKVKRGQIKELNNNLEKIYGVRIPEDFVFFKRKEYIYIVSKDFQKVEDLLKRLRVEVIGLKVICWDKTGIRFTIEGVQFFGKDAKKNVVFVDDPEKFLAGEDCEFKGEPDYKYVIVKHKDEVLGPGKIIKDKVRPFIGKERRIPKKYLKEESHRSPSENCVDPAV